MLCVFGEKSSVKVKLKWTHLCVDVKLGCTLFFDAYHLKIMFVSNSSSHSILTEVAFHLAPIMQSHIFAVINKKYTACVQQFSF